MCVLVVDGERRGVKVVLHILSGDGVLDPKNEMNLVGGATLVWSKHDGVAGVVLQVGSRPSCLLRNQKVCKKVRKLPDRN